MVIAPELLAILACPRCKAPVRLTPAGNALGCPRCRLAYPVVDDIPVMLPEEATPWDPDAAAGAALP
ncbi:MAG TPA: Trm112 family protein [Candidatus Methanoperedens sp.]|nr:Trm112 family protein [Candidatus Methanoperedens sp.]